MHIKDYKYQIILVLFIISLIASMILSFTPVSEFCNPSQGCNVVHNSEYNFTFGIQNSHYGILIFLTLSIITFFQIKKPSKEKKNIIHAAIIIGSLIALYFIYIQGFILNSYCKYCLVVDLSVLASLAIILITWKK